MPPLGTWAWAQQTGGRLRRRDRLTLIAQAVILRARSRLSGRRRQTVRHIDVERILPPDSAICLAAEAISAEASAPYLFNHCKRAYFWARLLNDDPKFDDEALYVSLLLHDLGLTERHRREASDHCFTLPAAREAHRLALLHEWPEQRAKLVANAICLHLNVTVANQHGREAQLVRIGSGADVAGLGLNRLDRDQKDQVVGAFPRLGMTCEIDRLLSCEVDACPCSRIAFLYTRLGFGSLIRKTQAFVE